MLSGSRRGTCHIWLGSPASTYLLPAGTKNNVVASVWTSPVVGSVVLFSACRMPIPNAEGSGLTEGAGGGDGG